MPKVSVVMPVYNGEACLREAIDSVIRQTFTDWELIIVNEFGSNQAATAILQEYAALDPRIRVIQNSTRLYIAESLNVGLRAAAGEYIARMDADDISGKKRLEVQVSFLDAHPEVDICGAKVTMFGEGTWDWKVYSQPEYLRCACLFYTPFIHPTVMMRSARLRQFQLEYDPDFHYTEDYDFFARSSEHLRFENMAVNDLYYYRFGAANATNVGGETGIRLQNKVMMDQFSRHGLQFTAEEIRLLSPNSYPKVNSIEEALDNLQTLDLLLKRIFLHDDLRSEFGTDILFSVLHRRWLDAYEKNRWQERVMSDGQVQQAVERGLFYHEQFYHPPKTVLAPAAPNVSIVVPTYNSEDYILDTIYSLLEQDYSDFELLVVNEYGSDDQTVKCVSMFQDPRTRVIQNTKKLGLAESLNLGFREARGRYIARADADDVYPRDRLSRQVEFLDKHPDIAICGTWQRHFGKRNHIHRPPSSPEEMKANLLFKCDVCHSTVMLRKDELYKRELWYDGSYLSEDYELWTRAAKDLKFATIPEVLGEYRWNGENITAKKMDLLDLEAQKIVARSLRENLGMEIADEDLILLSGWKNPFCDGRRDHDDLCKREEELLGRIESQNETVSAYDSIALKRVLDERRAWAGIARHPAETEYHEEVQEIYKIGLTGKIKAFFKRLFKRLYRPFRYRYENRIIEIEESVWRQESAIRELQRTVYDLDGHLYDYYQFLNALLEKQNEQISQMQKTINQRIQSTEEMILQTTDSRIWRAEQALTASTDARIWKAEQALTESTDARIWKAEQALTESTDARIWKAEQALTESTDARIWKAEQALTESTDARIWKAEQALTASTDARIWKAEENITHIGKDILQRQAASIMAVGLPGKRIFLIGTPEHNNIGDAAITVGEIEFIRRFFPSYYLIELTDSDLDVWYETLRSLIRPGDLICLQGGGNLGNKYLSEEGLRRRIIESFPDCPIIVLPQTVFFDDDDVGRRELSLSAGIYNRHRRLTVFTRGEQSLQVIREHFPQAKSACIPDMALLLEKNYGLERKGILLCIRDINDESGLTQAEYEKVLAVVREADEHAEMTDNLYRGGVEGRIYRDMRRGVVDHQLQRFASHQVVVTDRLHGLIFALITHTPCVVLSCYNYKIAEFCAAFVNSGEVFFIDKNLDQLALCLEKAMKLQSSEHSTVDVQLFETARRMIMEGLACG